MKTPFPWFGGKRQVAHLVCERFCDVPEGKSIMSNKVNPGPGTSICPIHGNVWLHTANPVMRDGITLSSNCDYEVRCGICGSLLVHGLKWESVDIQPEP